MNQIEEIMRQKQKDYFESIGKPYFNLDPYMEEAWIQIYAEERIPDSLEEVYSYAIRVAEKLMFVQS
jgi:hypothetical protein